MNTLEEKGTGNGFKSLKEKLVELKDYYELALIQIYVEGQSEIQKNNLSNGEIEFLSSILKPRIINIDTINPEILNKICLNQVDFTLNELLQTYHEDLERKEKEEEWIKETFTKPNGMTPQQTTKEFIKSDREIRDKIIDTILMR